MLGYTVQDMIGRSIFDFIDDKQGIFDKLNLEIISQGQNSKFDCELITKEGNRIYVFISTSALTDSDGHYIGILAAVMDITDRKRMEEEITFNNIILSIQQEVSPDGILFVDEHGKMTSSNQRFINIWSIPVGVVAARQDDLTLTSILIILRTLMNFWKKSDISMNIGKRKRTMR